MRERRRPPGGATRRDGERGRPQPGPPSACPALSPSRPRPPARAETELGPSSAPALSRAREKAPAALPGRQCGCGGGAAPWDRTKRGEAAAGHARCPCWCMSPLACASAVPVWRARGFIGSGRRECRPPDIPGLCPSDRVDTSCMLVLARDM